MSFKFPELKEDRTPNNGWEDEKCNTREIRNPSHLNTNSKQSPINILTNRSPNIKVIHCISVA